MNYLQIAETLGIWLVLLGLPIFVNAKVKNLATRQDIGKITEEVEKVRSSYALILEEARAWHQLKLGALDKRLQAHQEAFTLWSEMVKNTNNETFEQMHAKCSDWWDRNCLYLDADVRTGFVQFITDEKVRRALVASGDMSAISSLDLKFPSMVFNAVQLPSMTVVELQRYQTDRDVRKNDV